MPESAPEWLDADQAAARLGVKRATLYAYVSRGLVHREMDIDGRSSRFDPAEIDRLRSQARRTAKGELTTLIASGITRIKPDGHEYRGQSVHDLVAADTDFATVADLLWESTGDWGHGGGSVPMSSLPHNAPAIDRFRIAVATASANDVFRSDLSPDAMAQAGRIMVCDCVDALPLVGPAGSGSRVVDNLWPRLTEQSATDANVQALNAALVLMADHGVAASTFAVRIAASIRADAYSCVSAGLGALGGKLHGAASGTVHRLFARAAELGSAEQATAELLDRGERIPGWGHLVYPGTDPRCDQLWELVESAWAEHDNLAVIQAVRVVALERSRRYANVDFALGALTWLADMQPDAGEAIFAVARTAGWLAHAIEEHQEQPLRFRPEAQYRP